MRLGGAEMEEPGKRARLVGEIMSGIRVLMHLRRCDASRDAEEATGHRSVLRGDRERNI